jgi:UrcA family protein
LKTNTGRTRILATASVSLALLWAGAGINNAMATSPYESPGPQTLKVKDLDLSRPETVAVLYNRIVAASTNVCKPWNYDSTGAKVAWDACRDATISHTVASLNLPSLNSYYVTKTGQGQKAGLLASSR